MSRKRNASGAFPTPPLSAFAATKALRTESDEISLDPVRGRPSEPTLDYNSEDGMSEIDPGIHVSLDIEFGTWLPTSSNWKAIEKGEEVALRYADTLAVVGEYYLSVLSGLISINGAILTPKSGSQGVVAPTTEHIPVIQCFSSEGAVIALGHVVDPEKSYRSLSRFLPLFQGIWADQALKFEQRYSKPTFTLMYGSPKLHFEPSCRPLLVPACWQTLRARLAEHNSPSLMRKLVIFGETNSGSALLFKYLANTWATSSSRNPRHQGQNPQSLLFVELDASGTAFAEPGHISITNITSPILGPTFAIHRGVQIVRQHFVGLESTIALDDGFLDCARDLMTFAEETDAPFNVVVHAPECPQSKEFEWWDILNKLIGPSEKVFIGYGVTERQPRDAPPLTFAPPHEHKLPVYADQFLGWPRTRHQLRQMAFVSSFHSKPQTGQLDLTPITSWRPLCVSYSVSSPSLKALYVHNGMPQMYPGMLSTLLNGALVSIITSGLALSYFEERQVRRGEGDDLPYYEPNADGITAPINVTKSQTIGMAVVHSINVEKECVMLIVQQSIPLELFEDGIVIAVGLETPGWAYTEDVFFREYLNSIDNNNITEASRAERLLLTETEIPNDIPYISEVS